MPIPDENQDLERLMKEDANRWRHEWEIARYDMPIANLKINEDEAVKFLKEVEEYKRNVYKEKAEVRADIVFGSTSNLATWNGSAFAVRDSSQVPYEVSHDLSKYVCDHCGRGSVQLWREGKKNYDPPPRILCIWCVGDVVGYDFRGKLEDEEITIDSKFHGWVPAILYNNQGEHLVMPHRQGSLEDGVAWWLGLKK